MTGKISSEHELAQLAVAIIGTVRGLSDSERALCGRVSNAVRSAADDLKAQIRRGHDPLGEEFTRLRSAADRRATGAIYTPPTIVTSMLGWAAEQGAPARVVDPGAGSGRFLAAAAKVFPKAHLVGIELDPLAALLLRANLAGLGLEARSTVIVSDYRHADLPAIEGSTAFVGNPPYVRHHDIGWTDKEWYASAASAVGIKASRLAGLHLHFFFRTAQLARPGDWGSFVTSSEWMDVNYGSALRRLLDERLGAVALHVLDPKAAPFEGVATTGVITCFRVGTKHKMLRVRAVPTIKALNGLTKGIDIPWQDVRRAPRWSILVRPGGDKPPADFIELGEICRVSRGQVTGNNEVWIESARSRELPDFLMKPTVTRARELISAGEAMADSSCLRRVVDLPADLDELDPHHKRVVEKFLRWAKRVGTDQGYVARNRRAWWSISLYDPAPIVSTYMARRAPAFVRNLCDARHLNIAHGLYPREAMSEGQMRGLITFLRHNVDISAGRTYAGGLTKFEPGELARIHVPKLQVMYGGSEVMEPHRTGSAGRGSDRAVSRAKTRRTA